MSDIAIGLCDHHEGWAAAVALPGPGEALRVLDRRRLTLCGNGLPARVYHRVSSASPGAQQLIDTVREHATDAAREQLGAMVAALGAAGHRVRAAAVAISAVTVPDELDAVLASHTLWHEAEMQLYRDALVDAADEAGLAVVRYSDKRAFADAARQGGESESVVRQRVDALRADVGAPWTKVEKLAAAAALLCYPVLG